MFQFANPYYLFLLLILPVLVGGFIYINQKKRKDVQKLGDLQTMKQLMPELSLKRSYLKFWITFAVIALGIVVLARPQFGSKVEKVEKKGIEMVIAIDVSNSMLARDINPSRLAKAKQIMTRIINERKDDKVALVVFAGDAYVQMPMTTDTQSAKIFLDNINPSLVPVQGTAIASAIDLSIKCFSGDEDIDKAIVLITDGESHEGNAPEMAAQAVDKGVQVNVVGIGSAQGAPVPISENSDENKRDNDGNYVLSRLNEQMCNEIAQAGKGLYTHADNTNKAFKDLQAELEKLQKKKIDGTTYSEYDEKFYIFAWAMLVLLIVEVCIFDKKNRIFKNVRLFK
ncbi:Ca-activated chloride channel family protein [Dysgonomonas sp. PH5-45]|uniref:VWA domain-containing protein n=1 Tax=unclassified Dysgonomonas TaxID=2630389 RepID=UPI0024750DEF|nr:MULTISPECIES: VWA domain-containing protein [unclassified Dysgonomonas]MDH6355559.1 Ca-activated chloride channel family protein [Dysgonomonas sp. PH5-45]MDH6388456.1 Ca-activated chloride channel family protein [Dysgonomonas sp. PH5-37]